MRYAIYFTPPRQHPLTVTASSWLGRSAFGDEAGSSATAHDARHGTLTAEPRRYGFHATLKAPFVLADGCHETGLVAALQRFAAATHPFSIPELDLGCLGSFFALVPARWCEELQALADNVVRSFEPFRAPMSDADRARRNPDRLTPQQRDYLDRYGYPYVFEEFRFHMTLTGPVPDEEKPYMESRIEDHFADFLNKPLLIDHLALFVERDPGALFEVLQIVKLGNSSVA